MYWKADPSLPAAAGGSTQTDTFTGSVLVGDANAQVTAGVFGLSGVSYNDVPFTVGANVVGITGDLTCNDAVGSNGLSDLDLYLYGPAGNQIASSTNSGCPEHLSVPVSQAGQYTWRVYGFIAADTPYTLTSTQTLGGSPPNVNPIAANFVDASNGNRYDFDGTFDLTWTAAGSADSYEVEESTNGTNWNVVQSVAGSATGVSFANLADGTYNFRVRSIVPGRIGKYVTMPSNVASIIVAHRTPVDATASVDALNLSITFPPGSTEIVTALKNKSATVFYPNIRFEITSISSTGNTVKAINADNGGDGVATVAAFDYSQLVGGSFVQNQESGNKTLRFSNPNTVMFTFTARVIANVATATGGTTSGTSSGTTPSGTTSGGTTSGTGVTGTGSTHLLKFTVNPLMQLMTVQLL